MEAALISTLGRVVIGTTRVTIGHAPDNTIVLSDSKASSHHAEVRPEGQYYSLVDLGSTNGTFVNEQQVSRGVPRLLQSGDTVRMGETTFTFEVSGTPQGASYSEGSTVPATPPMGSSGAPPNFAGNTSYGMGNVNYGGQQLSYMPPQASYVSETQIATYVPSFYGQYGQQPAYAPPPPIYNPPPAQPQRGSPVRAIVLAMIAIIVILVGVGSFFIYHNNQVAQQNSNATATALSQQNATATALARTNLTATAIATSHYPPFTKVVLNSALTGESSGWDSNSSCQSSSAGYQVSIAQANNIQYCLNSGQFGEMAYQVTMSITHGDCGGLIFRRIDNDNFYFLEVCRDGTYNMGDFIQNHEALLYTNNRASSAIQQGLNKQNVVAITVQGDTVNVYVNGSKIDTATSSALTSEAFSQGTIGLLAEDAGDPTTVVYTNALVWTASS